MADFDRASDPGDPRLADFMALNDPAHRRRVERDGDYFVVEGVLAIDRLLDLADQWTIRSLALLPKMAHRLGQQITDAGIDSGRVAVADEALLRRVVGFDLHRGALASVTRRASLGVAEAVALARPIEPGRTDGSVDHERRGGDRSPGGGLLLVAEGVNDHENLGALYRNGAAFGVGAVLLDPTSADPFYRRSVRVSLGHVLAVPTAALGSGAGGIAELGSAGVTTVALTPGGEIALADLDRWDLGEGPVAVVVGAEGPGLTDATLAACDHRVAIEMVAGVDSLNVATAAAIALHGLRARITRRTGG